MDRREFLQKAALAGLAVAAPILPSTARAQSAVTRYEGPFWIFINADGGWEPTDCIDPKGRVNELQANPVNTYMTSDILQNGNLTFAPHPGFADFFNKYASRMSLIRGIDLATNGHGEGQRHSASGKLQEGNPSLTALVAATFAPSLPTAFLTAGGYDATNGIVGATRIGNPTVLQSIAFPNQINPQEAAMNQQGQPIRRRLFHRETSVERVERFRQGRMNDLLNQQRLPRLRSSIGQMYTAGLDQDTLKQVTEFMPQPLSRDRFESQVQIALAAYKAGASISMSIGVGGFDTHGNHDATHIPNLLRLFNNVDFLWNEADRLGIADRVNMVLTSEMGRTPQYNNGNGKDHWSITSAMFMGAAFPGNRVIGATNEGVEAMRVDPTTFEIRDPKDKTAVNITPAIIHDNLRTVAGVSEAFRREFPIYPEAEMNLFGVAPLTQP